MRLASPLRYLALTAYALASTLTLLGQRVLWTDTAGAGANNDRVTAVFATSETTALVALAVESPDDATTDTRIAEVSAAGAAGSVDLVDYADDAGLNVIGFAVRPLAADTVLAGLNVLAPGGEGGIVRLARFPERGAGPLELLPRGDTSFFGQTMAFIEGTDDVLVGGRTFIAGSQASRLAFVTRVSLLTGEVRWLSTGFDIGGVFGFFDFDDVTQLAVLGGEVLFADNSVSDVGRLNAEDGTYLGTLESPAAGASNLFTNTAFGLSGDTVFVATSDISTVSVWYSLDGVSVPVADRQFASTDAFVEPYAVQRYGSTVEVFGGRRSRLNLLTVELATSATQFDQLRLASFEVADQRLRGERASVLGPRQYVLAGAVLDAGRFGDADPVVAAADYETGVDLWYEEPLEDVSPPEVRTQALAPMRDGVLAFRVEAGVAYARHLDATGQEVFDIVVPTDDAAIEVIGAARSGAGDVFVFVSEGSAVQQDLFLVIISPDGEILENRRVSFLEEVERRRGATVTTLADGTVLAAFTGLRRPLVETDIIILDEVGRVVADEVLERDDGVNLVDGVAAMADGGFLLYGQSGDSRIDPPFVKKFDLDIQLEWTYESPEVNFAFPVYEGGGVLPNGDVVIADDSGDLTILDPDGRLSRNVVVREPVDALAFFGIEGNRALFGAVRDSVGPAGVPYQVGTVVSVDAATGDVDEAYPLRVPNTAFEAFAIAGDTIYLGGLQFRSSTQQAITLAVAADGSVSTRAVSREAQRFAVSPNPAAAGRVQLHLTQALRSVTIADALGRTTTLNVDAGNTIDVSRLSPGLYHVIATDTGGAPYVARLVRP